ncbi:MAG: hypothetical protein QXT36_01885 [Candidatus Micrarchaeaceae archaeon]
MDGADSQTQRFRTYAVYAIAACTFIAALISGETILLLATSALLLAAVAYDHSWRVINAAMIKKTGLLVVSNGYELHGSMHSAILRNGDEFESVSAALLEPPQKTWQGKSIAEIIEGIKVPFEFSIGIAELSKKRFSEDLETKRRMREIELANADPSDYEKISALRRELSLINSTLNSIALSKPITSRMVIRSFAKSRYESEAATNSYTQLKHIAELFSSAIGTSARILEGEELLNEV